MLARDDMQTAASRDSAAVLSRSRLQKRLRYVI